MDFISAANLFVFRRRKKHQFAQVLTLMAAAGPAHKSNNFYEQVENCLPLFLSLQRQFHI